MYQRILVPVDGSPTAERALQEAIKLAGSKGELRLIHVIEGVYLLDAEGFSLIDYPMLQKAVRHTGERILAKAETKAKESGRKVETALLDASGEGIAHIIDGEARKWPADLIVIGTHGRSGLRRLLMGSVAEGVVRGSPVPVLMVPKE